MIRHEAIPSSAIKNLKLKLPEVSTFLLLLRVCPSTRPTRYFYSCNSTQLFILFHTFGHQHLQAQAKYRHDH